MCDGDSVSRYAGPVLDVGRAAGHPALIIGLVLLIICLLLIVDIAGAIASPTSTPATGIRGRFQYPLAGIAGLLAITFAQGSKFSAGTMMYTRSRVAQG